MNITYNADYLLKRTNTIYVHKNTYKGKKIFYQMKKKIFLSNNSAELILTCLLFSTENYLEH